MNAPTYEPLRAEDLSWLGTAPIPAAAYYDPEWFELEREAVFKRAWLLIGHLSEIARPGSFIVRPLEVAGTFVSAASTKRTRWRESEVSRAGHLIPAYLAAWLLGLPRLVPAVLQQRMFPWSPGLAWIGVALVAAGLGFSVLAFVGTTLTLGQWRGLLALALITGSLVRKLRVEEARMGETFAGYADYRRASAALFPFIY